MQTEYSLSIITINYNGLNDTCALIESIPPHEGLEVIVIDNASDENEANDIEKRYPHVRVIKSCKNLGFAGGNNLGIQSAKGKYLFFLNNDTVFKIFNVQSLIDFIETSPQIAIVCPKIRFAWGENPIQYAGFTPLSKITVRNKSIGFGEEDHGQYECPHPTPYAHGAAMMIKKEAIDKVGLMPECYFLYYEEIDWSIKFTRAGYQIWYNPSCTIYHKESQSTGQKSPLRTYYITRNRLLLVKRNWHGIYKWLAYTYITCIVATRDMTKYICQKRYDLLKATWMGLHDFYKSKFTGINS